MFPLVLLCIFVVFLVLVLVLTLFVALLRSNLEVHGVDKRTVFITGCVTGFGNLLAKTLDKNCVQVLAGCLKKQGACDLLAQTSSIIRTVIIDITDTHSVQEAAQFVSKNLDKHGLWGLANNAGVMPNFAPVECTTLEEFELVCKVNLFGTISITLAFLPLLRSARGRLVNVCSVTSDFGYPGIANYSILKAGVKIFTTCLRRELLNSGVTTHTIEPGGFETNINNKDRLLAVLRKSYLRSTEDVLEFYGGHLWWTFISCIMMTSKYINPNPQTLTDAMTHAVLPKYPKVRYLVGIDANLFFRMLTYVPEWVGDYIVGWPCPYGPRAKSLDEM